jgi:tetratricopeptide (TPR) repeat protein
VPVDADREHYQSQAISMTHLQDISDSIPAKHVFFVADACYGGFALTRGAAGQNYLREVSRRVSRQVLTAGGAEEEVADNGPNGHSIFTWTLMQGLEGRADLNGDQFITGSELAAYVGPVVSGVSRQTPAFGNLPGSEGGEFVFELPHETEFLNELSTQLDQEAITLNAELDRVRAEVASKRVRNQKLRAEIAAAKAGLGAAAPAETTTAAATPAATMAAIDRGMVHFRERRYQDALTEFLAAAQANPSNALAANNVGYTYFKMERFAEAAQWYEKTIAIDPRRSIAHANLGDALLQLDRRDQARAAYEAFFALSPPQNRYTTTVRERLNTLGGPRSR